MRLLLYGNCQMAALKVFIDRSPDGQSGKIQTRALQDFQIVLGEVTKPKVREDLAWADTIIYHTRKGVFPNGEEMPPKPDSTLLTASVFYNGGYYLSCAQEQDWLPVLEYSAKHGIAAAAQFAVKEADLGYNRRWVANLHRMRDKEDHSNVEYKMRISDLVWDGTRQRQNITMNHPTSIVFVEWANRILKYLNFAGVTDQAREDARCNANIARLPCEDFVCSGAVKHLSMAWGGSDYEDQMCEGIAAKWLREHALSPEFSIE